MNGRPDDAAIGALAHRAGLQREWTDAHGRARQVGIDTLQALLAAMGLPCRSADELAASQAALHESGTVPADRLVIGRAGAPLRLPPHAAGACLLTAEEDDAVRTVEPAIQGGAAYLRAPLRPGYYRLQVPVGAPLRLAIIPRAAGAAARGHAGRQARRWGVMAQVYSLRHGDEGIPGEPPHGDFAAVGRLATRLAREGADVLALNPLHALFSADPAACSPYCPSSRLFWNASYAAPAAVLGEAAVRAALDSMPEPHDAALHSATLIDWPQASRGRLRLLRRLHSRFAVSDGPRMQAYRDFLARYGQPLNDHAVFESLHAAHAELAGRPRPWSSWDAAWRDARSPQVGEYALNHEQDVDFHRFLQWLAASSLAMAQEKACEAGMEVGLLGDLAVGAHPFGSQSWSEPRQFLQGVSIGAPPDIHNPRGQVWRLTAFSPPMLRQLHFQPFLDVLRSGLAYTGGLRIDHILGFQRLWVVPEGADAAEGAYLHMPSAELFALTALEAWRYRACVIGENLGTVPQGFDEDLHDHGIAGMSVLWFMRGKPEGDGGGEAAERGFLPPAQWPAADVAMTSTHDLPTLAGWWDGTDIAQRASAGLLGPGQTAEALQAARERDRARLWRAMGQDDAPPSIAPLPRMLGFVARAPSPLMLCSLEDLAAGTEAPNVPGTIDEFPNWRRRLPVDAVAALDTPAWRERIAAIQSERVP